MPRTIATDQRTGLTAAVRRLLLQQSGGLGIEALLSALEPVPPRRTLQRRLAALVQAGVLVTEGAARALRYRLAAADHEADPDAAREARFIGGREPGPSGADRSPAPSPASALPVSAEGVFIRQQVRRPLQQRRPVAYDIGLLEAYAPNRTFYLGDTLRAQLHTMGRSEVGEQAPAGTFARDILGRLLIDLSWASSQLEGNTYTRLDTERLISFGQVAEGRDAAETQMILNHKAAIEYLVGNADVAVDAPTMIALHALLSDGLLRDPMAVGRLRLRPVEIGGSVYRPIALRQRLKELFGIVLEMAAEITDPFEQAFFLMVHLPYLQPFEDVNKRVSRLAANIPLLRHNLCPLSFIDVPVPDYVEGLLGVYELARVELLRDVFVRAYERSCQQYVAVKQQLVPPDTFRLRYRAEVGQAVKALVQLNLSLSDTHLRRVTPATVAAVDRQRFAAQLRREFDTLHEGNAVRFGVRPLELAAWRTGAGARRS